MPEEVKKVWFHVWNDETQTLEYLWMEEEAYIEWDAAIEKEQKDIEDRQKELAYEERESWLYVRDD